MPINIDGNGSIGGLVAGGLPDATVTPTELTQPMTLMTAQNATGTSIDFTGIPAWVKRITVMFSGVSTNGSSNYQIQIGAGSFDATGYASGGATINNGNVVAAANSTTGFLLSGSVASTVVFGGIAILTLMGPNVWAMSFNAGRSDAGSILLGGGNKTLSGTLDRVRITTVNGTDTFDAGSINVMYEG